MSNLIDTRAAVWKSIFAFEKHLSEADEIHPKDFAEVKKCFNEFDKLVKESGNNIIEISEKLDELLYNPIQEPPPLTPTTGNFTPSVSEINLSLNTQKFLIVRGKVFNTDSIDFIDKKGLEVILRSGKVIHVSKEEMNEIFYIIQCNRI